MIRPFCGTPMGVSPIDVVTHNSKKRIIFDLRRLNDQLEPAPSFKMPRVQEAAPWTTPTSMLWTVDVTKMFYHIPVHPDLVPWLCFVHPLSQRTYAFHALPMGMQQAPYVATKTLAPVVHELMSANNINLLQYMDDALGVSPASKAMHEYKAYKSALTKYGWTVSATKCAPPNTTVTYLGFKIAVTPTPTISIVPCKRASMLSHVRALLRRRAAHSVRTLAQTLGELVSALPAAPTIRHHLSPLFANLSEAVQHLGWRSRQRVQLNEPALDALHTIKRGLAAATTTSTLFCPPPPSPTVTLTTDASTEFGWGATLAPSASPLLDIAHAQGAWAMPIRLPSVQEVGDKIVAARPTPLPTQLSLYLASVMTARPPALPSTLHITSLEATAVLFGVLATASELHRQRLLVQTDATAVVGALTKRASPSPILNHIIFLTHLALTLNETSLVGVTHVPGHLNTTADSLSRAWTPTNAKLEWPIDRRAPTWLWSTAFVAPTPPTLVDAFASSTNTVARRYWSYGRDPLSEAQNGLAQPWAREQLWINPPFELMEVVVRKVLADTPRRAIIITPEWPHQPWWRKLVNSPNIVQTWLLEPSDLLQTGPTPNPAEPMRNPRWRLRAWAFNSCLTARELWMPHAPAAPPWK